MASIIDVAKRAGVSPTTAKRAIREPHLLAERTLARVRKAIEELEYEPDETAGALRRGRSRSIGLIVGDILEPFFSMLTRTIGEEVRAQGYVLVVAESMYDSDLELANLRMFRSQRVSGLILRSSYGRPNYGYLGRMRRNGTSLVEIDYVHEGSPFSHVMLDNHGAVHEGLRHLARLGHRRVAPVAMQNTPEHREERAAAFLEGAAELGLELPDGYLPRTFRRYAGLSADLAFDLTLHLMNLPEPPTALFALTGTCGVGALRALNELGLAVPRDVSLLMFDNYRWTRITSPPLDVLEQPAEAMARAATNLVLQGIEDAKAPITQQRFPARLITRGSCGPPPERGGGGGAP